MNRLNNKVAIFTGGAQGMGSVTAELFAIELAKVVIADLNEGKGRQQTDKIKAAGSDCSLVKTGAFKSEDVQNIVKFTVDSYGRLDVAVYNAAITPDDKPIANFDEAYWDQFHLNDETLLVFPCITKPWKQRCQLKGQHSVCKSKLQMAFYFSWKMSSLDFAFDVRSNSYQVLFQYR